MNPSRPDEAAETLRDNAALCATAQGCVIQSFRKWTRYSAWFCAGFDVSAPQCGQNLLPGWIS